MQTIAMKRRRERPSAPPVMSTPSTSRPESTLFSSVDLTSCSFPPPSHPSSSSLPPASEDWTTTLSALPTPLTSLPPSNEHSEREQGREGGKKTVRRAKSQAEWSTASSASFLDAGGEGAWEKHVSQQPLQRGRGRRSLSLSLPSSSSSPVSRRSPSLYLPRAPPSPVVSWRGRHKSFKMGASGRLEEEVEGKSEERAGKKEGGRLGKKLSTLSLGALMSGGSGRKEVDEGRLQPPSRERKREGKKISQGSWEYQVAESLLFGSPSAHPPSRSPARSPRRLKIVPLELLPPSSRSTFTDSNPHTPSTPASHPLLVDSTRLRDLLEPTTPQRENRRRRATSAPYLSPSRSSLDSTVSSSLSFHSATSFAPFPSLFPAQSLSSPPPPSFPPLAVVKPASRASIQYTVPARSCTRASLASLTSLSPSLKASCVIDLTLVSGRGDELGDVVERTEVGTAATESDGATVVIPFPPAPLQQGGGVGGPTHLFPPSPPVPLSSQKQPKKLDRVPPVGAWLFFAGFLCPVMWWIGAVVPWERGGGGRGKKEGEEKGVEGGKRSASSALVASRYTNFPRSRTRLRTESALNRLLDGSSSPVGISSSPSTPEERRRAVALVWRRRNRLASLLSVVVVAVVVGFAAWGGTR